MLNILANIKEKIYFDIPNHNWILFFKEFWYLINSIKRLSSPGDNVSKNTL